MKIVIIADPIANFNPTAETTFFLMAEMTRRKWEVWTAEVKDIFADSRTVKAVARKVAVTKKRGQFSSEILKEAVLDLTFTDAILLRKDPPFDQNYFDHLTLLELLRGRTLLINDPSGIKIASEKIFPLSFHELSPPTRVSERRDVLREFIEAHGTAILKPLNLSGGRGILKVSAKDPSLNSLLDLMTENESRFIMAQKFLPAVAKGDKRILLLDGEILGAFLRVPHKADFRGNLHSGATLKDAPITHRDQMIVNTLKGRLKTLGLSFVGLDIIGDFVTEVNVTSPMGLGEINQLTNSQSEKICVNWVEKALVRAKSHYSST